MRIHIRDIVSEFRPRRDANRGSKNVLSHEVAKRCEADGAALDLALAASEASGISACNGAVAEWLKAAVC